MAKKKARKTGLYNIAFYGGVEPEVFGPYENEEDRTANAKEWWGENGPDGSIARLDIDADGVPTVGSYVNNELEDEDSEEDSEEDGDRVKRLFVNHYHCPQCGTNWGDEWDSTCDDDCPHCGCRHISPEESEDIVTHKYKCPHCGHEWDYITTSGQNSLGDCPECNLHDVSPHTTEEGGGYVD